MLNIRLKTEIKNRALCENDITACSSTKYLATAEKNDKGILIILYKRDRKESPFAVIDCQPEDFKVWYPETGKVNKGSVFAGSSGYENMLVGLDSYSFYYTGNSTYADVTFSSKEDKKIAVKFFSSYKKTYHISVSVNACETLPSPWKEFVWYQMHVLTSRCKKRNKKKAELKKQLFSYLKKPTQGFYNWVWHKAMDVTQCLFYTPEKKNSVLVECSVCEGKGTYLRKDIPNFQRNGNGFCPMCRAKVKFLPKAIQPGYRVERMVVSYLQKTPDGFVWRDFTARRVFSKKDLPHVYDELTEITRWYTPSNVGYMLIGNEWCRREDGWFVTSMVYPRTIRNAIKDTKYRYSGLEELVSSDIPMRYSVYLLRTLKYPVLEKLAKAGYHSVIKQYLEGYWFHSPIKVDASTIYEALGISRFAGKRIAKLNLTNSTDALQILRTAEKYSLQIKDEDILEIINTEMMYENLNKLFHLRLITHLSVHKLCRYLMNQKKFFKNHINKYKNQATEIDIAITTYEDYINMGEMCGYDVRDRGFTLHPNLYNAHKKMVKEYNATQTDNGKKEDILYARHMAVMEQQMLLSAPKAMAVNTDDLFLKGLWTPQDLRQEGKRLHNCIGTYISKVADGSAIVVAVRKKDHPNESYCAFEYRDGKIIQCRADHEMNAPDDVWKLANQFCKVMNSRKPIAA